MHPQPAPVKKTTIKGREISKLAFELRYDSMPLLWDNAGKIWTDIQGYFAEFPVERAQPNAVRCIFDNDFDVNIELERLFVIWNNNKNDLRKFTEVCETVVSSFHKHTGVSFFTRMGLRTITFDQLGSIEEASNKVIAAGAVKPLKGKFFGLEGKQLQPELKFIWEDEDLGVLFRFFAIEHKLKLAIPVEFQKILSPMEEKLIPGVSFDIDYYTKKKVPADLILISEWIKQVIEVVEKDLDNILTR